MRALFIARGTQTVLFTCSHVHLLERYYRNTAWPVCKEGIKRAEDDRNQGSSKKPGVSELMMGRE